MLRDEMPISELRAMGIELQKINYEDRLYFDAVVRGDQVEDLGSYEMFQFAVSAGLMHETEFLDNLAGAEILSPYYAIPRYLNPSMMRVRVNGYSLPDNETVCVMWKWFDIKRDITEFWNSLLSGIKHVQTANAVSDEAERLLSCVNVKSVMENYAGIWMMLDAQFSKLDIQSMTRTIDCQRYDDGDTLLCFRGRYASFTLQSGEIITFVVQKSGEGIYHHCMYYRERVICDEDGT